MKIENSIQWLFWEKIYGKFLFVIGSELVYNFYNNEAMR